MKNCESIANLFLNFYEIFSEFFDTKIHENKEKFEKIHKN